MEYKNFNANMFPASPVEWNAAVNTTHRKNLEKTIYDFSFDSGVLTGLELVQAAAPNLTVVVKVGRGVYRNPTTRQAKVIEVHTDYVVDLSAVVAGLTLPTKVKIVASPLVNNTVEAPITVNNAALSHPDYDAGFTPYAFNPLERDDALIEVDNTPNLPQIVLGEVSLTPGQTQILNSNLDFTLRQVGGFATAVTKLVTDFEALKTAQDNHITSLAAHKAKAILLEPIEGLGAEKVQTGIAELLQRIIDLEGATKGRFVRVATSPFGDGGVQPWRLYRTRGIDGAGANVGDWGSDKTIGPTGSGADIIWTALDDLQGSGATSLALSATSSHFNLTTPKLRVGDGDLASLAAVEPIIDLPSSGTLISQKVPWLVVKTDAQRRFKIKVEFAGFAANNFQDYALFLQGYFY